ncbi:helix-turn-helix domain-containing protein [Bermanella sp. R86510]|uniref:helix-turn-helix domain-containing protein n=1 Tax=unclassified Bermanella TaxID=2627862 RepID=UPI0037C63B92
MVDKGRGKRIKEQMERLNIIYEELAEHCGVSVKAVYKWTAGHNLPAIRVIQLSKALRCTTDYLLLGVVGPKEDTLLALVDDLPQQDKVALFNYLDAIYNKK